jgi:hypothetical protein
MLSICAVEQPDTTTTTASAARDRNRPAWTGPGTGRAFTGLAFMQRFGICGVVGREFSRVSV